MHIHRAPTVLAFAGLIVITALAVPASSLAAQPPSPTVSLPLMQQRPTIDGVIDEDEWKGAVRNVGFVSHSTGRLATRDGVFWIGADLQKDRQTLERMKKRGPKTDEMNLNSSGNHERRKKCLNTNLFARNVKNHSQ